MHTSETKIMKIQKLIYEHFSAADAIAVHGALTTCNPSQIEESHGLFGGNALYDLQSEYQQALKEKNG